MKYCETKYNVTHWFLQICVRNGIKTPPPPLYSATLYQVMNKFWIALKKGNNRNDDDNFDKDCLNHHSDSNSQSNPSITYFEVQVVIRCFCQISNQYFQEMNSYFDNSNSYWGENPTASIDGGGSLSFSDWKPAAKVLSTWGKKTDWRNN